MSEEGKMEIRSDNKFITFIKRFGLYILGGFVILAIIISAIVAGVMANKNNPSTEVTTEPISFSLPMNDASIIKDFSDTNLQFNETLNKYEAHLSVDLTSEDPTVMAIADGTVTDVSYKYLTGYTVTITHSDGFVSVYSSLDENVDVKEGDSVKKGTKIGSISTSAAGEASYGDHLDLTIYLNNEEVDPNNYLSLQEK